MSVLYRITTPAGRRAFSAGLILEGDRVVSAAPILRKRFLGRGLDYIRRFCDARGWRLERVS